MKLRKAELFLFFPKEDTGTSSDQPEWGGRKEPKEHK